MLELVRAGLGFQKRKCFPIFRYTFNQLSVEHSDFLVYLNLLIVLRLRFRDILVRTTRGITMPARVVWSYPGTDSLGVLVQNAVHRCRIVSGAYTPR